MSKKITLYVYVTSPYANKVKCFLDYKNLDYRVIHVDPMERKDIAFTKQKQIPVLKVRHEWRVDSTPIGLWLDELFPETKLIPSSKEKDKILKIDRWISNTLIASIFRQVAEWKSISSGMEDGWKLSSTLNKSRPLSKISRFLWPIGLKHTGFIKRIANQMDHTETIEKMRKRVIKEFLKKLGKGPYLGGYQKPTLADLSAYPQFALPHAIGMNQAYPIDDYPKIKEWMKKVQKHLPKNTLLIKEECIVNKLP